MPLCRERSLHADLWRRILWKARVGVPRISSSSLCARRRRDTGDIQRNQRLPGYDIPYFIMHAKEPWFICWLVCVNALNLMLLWLWSKDIVQYFGFRQAGKLYAIIFWKDLWDWSRKQKPPARRIEKGVEAIKRLMQ